MFCSLSERVLCSSAFLPYRVAYALFLSLISASSSLLLISVASSCYITFISKSFLLLDDRLSLLLSSSKSCWLRLSSSLSLWLSAVRAEICWLAFFRISWMFSRTIWSSPQETLGLELEALNLDAVSGDRAGWREGEGWATLVGVPLDYFPFRFCFRQLIIINNICCSMPTHYAFLLLHLQSQSWVPLQLCLINHYT